MAKVFILNKLEYIWSSSDIWIVMDIVLCYNCIYIQLTISIISGMAELNDIV